MDLLEKIDRIIFQEDISLKIFLEKTEFSKGLYYSIKEGVKTSLKPNQAKSINKAFPDYTYEWLMFDGGVLNKPSATYGTVMDLASEGKLGIVLNKSHNELLKLDETYLMWFDKEVNVRAMRLLKDMTSDY